MAVGICLHGCCDAPPGRAVAAFFSIFFVSDSSLKAQANSEWSRLLVIDPLSAICRLVGFMLFLRADFVQRSATINDQTFKV